MTTPNRVRRARAVAEVTLANGGGTFDRDTFAEYAGEGYAVGGIVPNHKVHAPFVWDILANAILGMRADMIARGIVGGYIGTWVEAGVVFIDAVVILPDRASALILARALGERAIYSFASGETIEVIADL